MTNCYEYIPLETNNPLATFNLILLHGYGADGFNLLNLGFLWQQSYPQIAVYALQAPEPCLSSPGGRQWFNIETMEPHKLYKDCKKASKYLKKALIYAAEKTQIPLKRTILMGFSQGAMMALFTSLYCCPNIKGVLSYSGGVFSPDPPLYEARNMDICLIHGTSDTIVPLDLFELSAGNLLDKGLNVEKHLIKDLDHSINDKAFKVGKEFIGKILTTSRK